MRPGNADSRSRAAVHAVVWSRQPLFAPHNDRALVVAYSDQLQVHHRAHVAEGLRRVEREGVSWARLYRDRGLVVVVTRPSDLDLQYLVRLEERVVVPVAFPLLFLPLLLCIPQEHDRSEGAVLHARNTPKLLYEIEVPAIAVFQNAHHGQ